MYISIISVISHLIHGGSYIYITWKLLGKRVYEKTLAVIYKAIKLNHITKTVAILNPEKLFGNSPFSF